MLEFLISLLSWIPCLLLKWMPIMLALHATICGAMYFVFPSQVDIGIKGGSKHDNKIDPFASLINRGANPIYQKAKFYTAIALGIPFFRALFIAVVLCVYVLLANVILFGQKESSPPTPIMGWRRAVRDTGCRVLLRCVLFACGYYYIKVEGRVDKRARVFVCNHGSNTDAFVLAAILGDVIPLGKAEVARTPFMGSLIKLQQSILVDRTLPDSRSQSLKEMVRRSTSPAGWPPILLFPEGTRTNGSALITFKRGAFSCGAVGVQPITLNYPFRQLNNSTCSVVVNELQQTFALLCEVYNNAEMTILPVHLPDTTCQKDPFVFSEIVRKKMALALSVPVCDHSFEDTILLKKARKENRLMDISNLQWEHFRKEFGASIKELTYLLDQYILLDKTKRGYVSVDEFYPSIDVEASEARLVFNKIDRAGDGRLSFLDYASGVYNSMTDPTLPACMSWLPLPLAERKTGRRVR